MSQENVEIVRATHAAWNRKDLDGFLDRLDENLHWHTAAERIVGGHSVHTGHEGAREAWAEYRDLFQDFRVERSNYFDLGDRVLVLGYLEAKGRGSGADVHSELAQLMTVRGGKIVRSEDYLSHAEGRNAAGLSGQDAHADS